MNIQELRKIGKEQLIANNIEDALINVEILMQFILNMSKIELIVYSDREIEQKKVNTFLIYIDELIKGKPIQYITNEQEFMKLKFYIDENVLIPQPDTEILVEEVLQEIKELAKEKEEVKILDLCTGSGAIAISIKKYAENAIVFASDISEKAIEIAEKNALNNKVEINFINSDMFDKINEKDFDVIVSNPPYIQTETIKGLSKEVQNEPIIALDGGEDGLDFYRIIADNGYKYLNENGRILLEIGYNQREEVMNLLKKEYDEIKCVKDLANNDRVISAKYKALKQNMRN